MPTPKWRERLPKAQSMKDRFIHKILDDDKNLKLGPDGATAQRARRSTDITPRKEQE